MSIGVNKITLRQLLVKLLDLSENEELLDCEVVVADDSEQTSFSKLKFSPKVVYGVEELCNRNTHLVLDENPHVLTKCTKKFIRIG